MLDIKSIAKIIFNDHNSESSAILFVDRADAVTCYWSVEMCLSGTAYKIWCRSVIDSLKKVICLE